ncbi:MAG: hypothetical protein K2Q01_03860, partial [Rickettsiales bacterium]|nr:hypothetical protein [Rickettsiales bacterium]
IDLRDDISAKAREARAKMQQNPAYTPTDLEAAYISASDSYLSVTEAAQAFNERVAQATSRDELYDLLQKPEKTPEGQAWEKARRAYERDISTIMRERGIPYSQQQDYMQMISVTAGGDKVEARITELYNEEQKKRQPQPETPEGTGINVMGQTVDLAWMQDAAATGSGSTVPQSGTPRRDTSRFT